MKNRLLKKIVNFIIIILGIALVCFMLLWMTGVFDEGGLLYQYLLQNEYDSGERERVLTGGGTIDDPFLVRCKAELIMMDELIESDENAGLYIFSIENDIDLKIGKGTRCIMLGEGEDYSFQGTILGNGHTIKNLELTPNEFGDPVGFVPELEGEIINLCLEGNAMRTEDSSELEVGGFAGIVQPNGYIENCISKMNVPQGGSIAGVSYGRIINCLSLTDGDLCPEPLGDVQCCYKACGGRNFPIIGRIPSSYLRISDGAIIKAGEVVGELDGNLGQVDPTCREHPNNKWAIGPVVGFSDQKSDGAYTCRISLSLDGEDEKIDGFYSVKNSKWIIPIPCGSVGKGCRITLKGNESDADITTEEAVNDYSLQLGDVNYNVTICPYDDMPAIFINTAAGNGIEFLYENKQNDIPGDAAIYDPGAGKLTDCSSMVLSCRGNDSYQPYTKWKGSFALTLKDRQPLLGLSENEDFVLLAGYRRDSVLSYILEKDMAKADDVAFAYDYRMVHVYVDGKYRGFYMLTGSQEIDKGRFDLHNSYRETQELNDKKLSEYEKKVYENNSTGEQRVYYDIPKAPENVTGGYLLEADYKDYPDSRSRFITKKGTTITMKSNPYAAKAQVDYAADLWQDFEDALFSEDGYNEKGGYYADYMDLDSMADLCLAMEISADTSLSGSVYFYTDLNDGKLHAAQRWDSEQAFAEKADGSWLGDRFHSKYTNEKVEFWYQLYRHEDFVNILKEHWNSKYKYIVSDIIKDDMSHDEDGVSTIEYYREKYGNACHIDDLRWEELDFDSKCDSVKKYLERRYENFDNWVNGNDNDKEN